MASFFKSYIITLLIAFCVSIAIILYFGTSQLGMDTATILNSIKLDIALQLVMNFVLMFVVAFPFFTIVRKFGNFTWFHGIIMWFLVFLCSKYISQFVFGAQTIDSIRNLWLAAIILGLVFMPIYKAFQKREAKPNLSKTNEVFE